MSPVSSDRFLTSSYISFLYLQNYTGPEYTEAYAYTKQSRIQQSPLNRMLDPKKKKKEPEKANAGKTPTPRSQEFTW